MCESFLENLFQALNKAIDERILESWVQFLMPIILATQEDFGLRVVHGKS
jgi:hypothetical protein